jgi:hypothetical protein
VSVVRFIRYGEINGHSRAIGEVADELAAQEAQGIDGAHLASL